MSQTKILLGAASLAVIALAACTTSTSTDGSNQTSSTGATSSLAETQNVTYQGTLSPAGASIFMEGTHKLTLSDGRFIMLKSSAVKLDDYVNKNVEVFGAVRPTVEAGGIIMDVETITDLTPSSSSVSSMSSSVSSAIFCGGIAGIQCPSGMDCIDNPNDSCDPKHGGADCGGICVTGSSSSSSASSIQSSSKSFSSAFAVASSISSKAMSSSASVSSAAYQASAELTDKANTMAKDNMGASFWTQQYCSKTAAFCIPVQKNWYFQSFGAEGASLWHVEVGPSAINVIGDGPITIDILSGSAAAADGSVQMSGGAVVGYKEWTNGRHIEIRAPAVLQAAVTYMTAHLTANAQ
jgi:hypothetical protein